MTFLVEPVAKFVSAAENVVCIPFGDCGMGYDYCAVADDY